VEFPQQAVAVAQDAGRAVAKLFMGQLPYEASPRLVAWLVKAFAGCDAFHAEMIRKWTGARRMTGCVHLYVYADEADHIIAALHRRVLVDAGGVWHAESAAEHAVLEAHCAELAANPALRFNDLPHQSVVVQRPTSSYHTAFSRAVEQQHACDSSFGSN